MRTASIIALMMEAESNSETSVNFNVTTRRFIPEDSKLHSRRRENLKSQGTLFETRLFSQKSVPDKEISKGERKYLKVSLSCLYSAVESM
jgi:hypothetical protein